MIVWRISNHASLDGGGGLKAAARWHSKGRRIVYCAPNPATALLEVIVHTEVDVQDLPRTFRLLKIDIPDTIALEELHADGLPERWHDQPEITQRIGDAWLSSNRNAVLQVPCVIVPETMNILINPSHPNSAQIAILNVRDHAFDPRLF